MPSVGVFQRDPSPYLSEFRSKPRKTPNGYVDKRELVLNRHLPSTSLKGRTAQPLVGPSYGSIQKQNVRVFGFAMLTNDQNFKRKAFDWKISVFLS